MRTIIVTVIVTCATQPNVECDGCQKRFLSCVLRSLKQGLLSPESPCTVSGSCLRFPFTQTLKSMAEKLPYFYQCCYSPISCINTPKNVFSDLVQPHMIQAHFLVGAPVLIHCFLLFGTTKDASCLSHLKNALTSTKLQSQVPECLAKPFPPLPWWDVLTPTPPSSLHVSVALPRCRSGMWLISSSLHELRHPFFRVL